jgi:hypothetical protein
MNAPHFTDILNNKTFKTLMKNKANKNQNCDRGKYKQVSNSLALV